MISSSNASLVAHPFSSLTFSTPYQVTKSLNGIILLLFVQISVLPYSAFTRSLNSSNSFLICAGKSSLLNWFSK